MAIKALNSVAGFSVGEVPANIILANGDITSNNGTFTANISAGNVKTDNLLYANGVAWDLGGQPGGSNTYVQFNDAGEFGGSTNFTFNKSTNVLTVTGNIAGTNVNAGNLLTANYVTGTLTTAAQPNITSVGTLTGLVVGNGTANVTFNTSGNGTLTATGNITAPYFIGNVQGNISGNIVVPGNNTAVIFNDGGNAGASDAFTFNKASNLVTITSNANVGNLNSSGVVSATGNVSGGNLTTGGVVDATGNVSGGNITTGGVVSATGNVSGGNITTGGVVSATGNVTGGNLTTGGVLSVTGNANVGNLGTAGLVTATGNVSGGNLTTGGAVVATGNVSGGNLVTLGKTDTNNFKISGTVEGNLIPSVSNTYSLGNGTNYWKDLFLSGTTITIGDQTISANAGGISLSNTAFMTTLSVSGNANVGNLGTAGLIVATGNIDGGNLNTGGVLSVTGNANVGNLGTAGLIVATGNITGGNLMGPLANGNSNVRIATTNGNITLTAVGNTTMTVSDTGANITGTANISGNANVGNLGTTALIATGTGSFGANVNMNSQWINNVGYPSATTDVATKEYVDTMVSSGIAYHQPVLAATTGTLDTATGGTVSYNNGTAGVGANLVTTGTFLLIDGANVQTVGTRILVKNEANAAWNGVYEYTSTTVITRTSDADTYGPDSTTDLSINDYFFVQGGVVNEGVAYIVSAPSGTITFGTSNITFAQFSSSQVYDAGTGLTLANTTFSISNTAVTAGSYGNGDRVATFTVNGQGQLTAASNTAITANAANLTGTTLAGTIVNSSLTSVGTLGSLAVTANITAGNVTGANLVSANYFTGTLTTASQPNITSVGSLSSLTVTGTTNLGAVGNVTITGGTSGYYLQTNGSGTLTWAAVPTGTGISNGTSNVSIPVSNGNINMSVGGNANVLVVTDTGVNVAGNLSATGSVSLGGGSGGNLTGANNISANTFTGTLTTNAQPNITSVGTLTSLAVTGNITSGNANLGNLVTANFFSGAGNNLSNIQGGNVSGQVGNALVAGTVYTNAQPNITSTGTLTGLTVTGNTALSGANVSLGAIANLHITGGTSGYVLSTDGSGNLSWVGVSSSSISNGNSNVNIPSANGNVNISAVGNANVVVVTGTGLVVNGSANVTGNLTAGNIVAGAGTGGNITGANLISANYFTGTLTTAAQPNITSVGTLTSLSVTGNITSGNANLGNLATANFFSGSGNLLSNIQGANVSGTVSSATTAGTVTTAAQPNITSVGTLTSLTASGNITGGNLITTGVAVANSGVQISNSAVYFATVTTTATTANQTIATLAVSGSYVTGVEYLVKGVDATGTKYSVATVVAVTNGSSADYSTFATVNLGGATGSLAVNISGSNIALQVTPASSNSTVWTTQYRTI